MNLIDKIKYFFSGSHDDIPSQSPQVDKPQPLTPKDEWMIREMEFQCQPEYQLLRSDGHPVFTLGYVLSHQFKIEQSEIINATFVSSLNAYEPKQVQGGLVVWNFDLSHSLDYKGKNSRLLSFDEREMSIVITCKPNQPDTIECPTCYTVLVHLRGETDKLHTKYIRISVTVPPFFRELPPEKLPLKSKRWDALLAFDEEDFDLKMKEFEFLRDDALDKYAKGNEEELTQTQNDMLFLRDYSAAMRFFIARDLVERNHFELAASIFVDVFNNLNDRWVRNQLDETENRVLFESIFNLAICHSRLHLYSESIYYFNMLSANNPYVDSYVFLREYISTLVASSDLRTLFIVNDEMDRIEELKKKKETVSADDEQFLDFLRLKRGEYFMRRRMYDYAEKWYKSLLDIPSVSDSAINALAFIQSKRKVAHDS